MSDTEPLLKKEKKKKEEKKQKEKIGCKKCPHRPAQSLTLPSSPTKNNNNKKTNRK